MTKSQQSDLEMVAANLEDAIDFWPAKTLEEQLEKLREVAKAVEVFLDTETVEDSE